MDSSKPKANDNRNSSRNATTMISALELAQQYLDNRTALPSTSSTSPPAATLPERQTVMTTNDASALLLKLMLPSGGGSQPNGGGTQGTNTLLLLQQLAQSDPNAIARLATCSAQDLKAANLQAQALLRQQEETLRNTRLLLQQQLEQLMEEDDTKAAAVTEDPGPTAPAAARAASPPGDTTTASVPSTSAERRPSQASNAAGNKDDEGEDNNTVAPAPSRDDDKSEEGGETPRDIDSVQYDDDELDDDAYFKNFDKEDSHKVNNETFPFRLYRMLYEVEKSGKQDVAAFSTDGKMFCVRKPKRFVEEIMPQYFTTSRLASFQRQLNLYGFQRVSEGGLRGSYYHSYFLKGKRALCRKIKRQRTRTKAAAAASSSSMMTSQSAQVLPVAATNNLTFNNTLQLSGDTNSRASLILNNAAAAAELLRRAATSMESDRALDTRAGLALQSLLESPPASIPSRQSITLPTVAASAPAPAVPSLIAAIQNSPNLRRSLTAPDPAAASPAMDIQQLVISRLQRENEELAQRLQAERDAPGLKRDPS